MTHRIAIASSDGENIDLHFARATQFYIYDVNDNTFEFVENRRIYTISLHEESEFEKALQKINDCMAVIVSQIGEVALAYVLSKGIRVFEAPFPIDNVMEKLVKDKILNNAVN